MYPDLACEIADDNDVPPFLTVIVFPEVELDELPEDDDEPLELELPEDDEKGALDDCQKLTDKKIEEVEAITKKKQDELMSM